MAETGSLETKMNYDE